MAQRTDLYSILVSYANKNNSPYIEIDPFLDFLGRYARKQSVEQPEWLKWVENRNIKFWAEVSVLAENGKCEVLTDTEPGRIFMPRFYLDLIEGSYSNADKEADLPFPSEESLKIGLPENQLRVLSSEEDILIYLEDPQTTDFPIIKLNFPYGFGSALVLASFIPKRLVETAIIKIRNYLQHSGNKEYALRKLTPQLQGRESFVKEQFNQILMRHQEACRSLEDGKELTYLFWAHFCLLVKNDIKKKKDHLGEDIAALQSVFILDAINSYYKNLANKKREEEMAFRALENQMGKAPFLYTLTQILRFKDANGIPLLGRYSGDNLDLWIKQKTTESKNNELPELLILQGFDEERYFCFKNKMLTLCVKLLAEARRQVLDAVSKHWHKLLFDYEREPAMDSDEEFEKLLSKMTKKLCPALAVLLGDPKLLLIYEETENEQHASPLAVKIFNNGQLAPYSSLYIIKRKELLAEAKLILPFWYSIPIISGIIAFFKRLTKRRHDFALAHDNEETETAEEKDRAAQIRTAAEEIEATLVPPGYTLDSYLEELENRWSRLIDKKARENLIEDVRSLIRDHLRANLKLHKKFQLTRKIISQMAVSAIVRSPTLSSLSGRDSLVLYAELYLLKLLQTIH